MSSASAILTFESDWTIKSFNNYAKELLGIEPATMPGLNFRSLCSDEGHWLNIVGDELSNGGSLRVTRDVRISSLKGRTFWCRTHLRLRRDEHGSIHPVDMALTDVDDIYPHNPARLPPLAMMEKVLGTLKEVFWWERVSDKAVLFISQSFEDVWGIPRSSIACENNNAWIDSIHEEDRERVIAFVDSKFAAGEPYEHEYRIRRRDGTERLVRDRGIPILNEDGQVESYGGIAQDITDQAKQFSDLVLSEKKDLLSSISSDISHKINNILSIISIEAANVKRFSKDEYVVNKMESVISATERGGLVTQALMSMAQKRLIVPLSVNVNDIIKNITEVISASAGPSVSVLMDLGAIDRKIPLDVAGFSFSVLNIITNAREAMPDGGVITVSTRLARCPNGSGLAGDCRPAADVIELSIEDTGPGMSAQIMSRAFEPYFTTKIAPQGSGVGLAAVKGFMDQMGGWVQLLNRPQGGLAVKMYFPLNLQAATPPASKLGPSNGAVRILVVDDEQQLLESICDALSVAGFDVGSASNVEQALDQLSRLEYDLLICDVTFHEKLNGYDVVKWIEAHCPTMPVLLMSGYSDGQPTTPERVEFILKPFKMEDLLISLQAILGVSARKPDQLLDGRPGHDPALDRA